MENFHHSVAIESLLDVGIGGGRTTEYLLDNELRIAGLDCSADFVPIVGTHYPQALYFSKKWNQ